MAYSSRYFFEQGDPNQCAELVNGSNGNLCGDYVTDTPADPRILGQVNSSCNWTGSGMDSNGDNYNPDETLIMSYSTPTCLSQFTSGQKTRMLNAIESLESLNNAIVPTTSGPSLLCNNSQATYTLSNVPSGTTVTWSKSSNLTIVSGQSTSSVTVRGASSGNGDAWVRATLNGACGNVVLGKYNFWVGKPDISNATVNEGGTISQYASYSFSVSGEEYATHFEWIVPFGWQVTSYGTKRSATITPTTTGAHTIYAQVHNECSFSYVSAQVCVEGSGYSCRGFTDPDDPCADADPNGPPYLPDDPNPQIVLNPNPSNGEFDITFLNVEELLSYYSEEHVVYQTLITDISGNEKYRGTINKNGLRLNVKHLPKGIYVVKVYNNDSETFSRLVLE